jgi:hypothetical protein
MDQGPEPLPKEAHLIWLCKQIRTITGRFTRAKNLRFSPDSQL